MTAVADIPTVKLERFFKVSTQRLYSLMTTPRYMEQWFSPSDEHHVAVKTHEFHEDGAYALAYRNPEGEENLVKGTFISIKPEREVAFTWTWQEPDPHAGIYTLVTWLFEASEGGCRLIVTHEKLPDSEARERHSAGWEGTLDRLTKLAKTQGA